MTITEAEAHQLEILASSLLRLIADWREQRRKNEAAADAYHAGYRAAQEAIRQNLTEEWRGKTWEEYLRDLCGVRLYGSVVSPAEIIAYRTQHLERTRHTARANAQVAENELAFIRKHASPTSDLSPEEAMDGKVGPSLGPVS